jgi:hypothetical protein
MTSALPPIRPPVEIFDEVITKLRERAAVPPLVQGDDVRFLLLGEITGHADRLRALAHDAGPAWRAELLTLAALSIEGLVACDARAARTEAGP